MGRDDAALQSGCGAGMSGIELFGEHIDAVRYLGADISEAVDVAAARFAERNIDAAFIQADITRLPLADNSIPDMPAPHPASSSKGLEPEA